MILLNLFYFIYSSLKCSLNGDYINNKCICDKQWKGNNCDINVFEHIIDRIVLFFCTEYAQKFQVLWQLLFFARIDCCLGGRIVGEHGDGVLPRVDASRALSDEHFLMPSFDPKLLRRATAARAE